MMLLGRKNVCIKRFLRLQPTNSQLTFTFQFFRRKSFFSGIFLFWLHLTVVFHLFLSCWYLLPVVGCVSSSHVCIIEERPHNAFQQYLSRVYGIGLDRLDLPQLRLRIKSIFFPRRLFSSFYRIKVRKCGRIYK